MQLEHFFNAPLIIQIHATAAISAFLIGMPILALPKGNTLHRGLGITAAALLLVTALSAIFIRQTQNGWPIFSLIHLFVPLTFMGLFGLVMGFQRRNLKQHRNAGRGLILGALLIPGIIAFMPGRMLHYVAFGA